VCVCWQLPGPQLVPPPALDKDATLFDGDEEVAMVTFFQFE
jgi:hypothetical protein